MRSINKKSIMNIVLVILAFVFFSGCGLKVMPEAELKKLNAQKILDLAAEKYSIYEYEEAIYYYKSIGDLFPQDSDDVNDQKAWALYEIGFIRFQQGRINEASSYFERTLKTKSQSNAPRILATEMIEKIRNRK